MTGEKYVKEITKRIHCSAQKKKDIRAEIKELEAQLAALGLKKSEIKKIKDEAKGEVTD